MASSLAHTATLFASESARQFTKMFDTTVSPKRVEIISALETRNYSAVANLVGPLPDRRCHRDKVRSSSLNCPSGSVR